MALDAKWNDDLDLARVIQTPKVGLGPFISQPEIPIESFNPMGYTIPGVGGCHGEDFNEDFEDDFPRICQRRAKDTDIFRPKLKNPLPLPHPVDIVAIIHNRDHPGGGGGTIHFIDLDGWTYEVVRRSLIELPTPFGLAKSPSLFSEDENELEEEDSTIRKSLTIRDKEEETSATSSYQASAEDTPLVLRSATSKLPDKTTSVNSKVMLSPIHQYEVLNRLDHTMQQSNVLEIGDILNIEKQKKLSTIASESDVGLNTEEALSEALGITHNDESEFHNKDSSLNCYGEGVDVDPDMASLTKSLEELDRDLIDNDVGNNKSPSTTNCHHRLDISNVEIKGAPNTNNTDNHTSLEGAQKSNGETLEQTVRHAMKERDKRDAALVSAAVFSSLRKNSIDGSQSSFTDTVTYRSPRKQKYYLENSRNYFNHNLHFPPIANSTLGVDSEDGQDSDPALSSTPPAKAFAEYSMKEFASCEASSRARNSYNSKPIASMGRRSTSTSGVDEPPQIPIRHAYQRSFSHTRSTKVPSGSDVLLASSFSALNRDGKSTCQSKDILKSKDSIPKNPDSYSTVV